MRLGAFENQIRLIGRDALRMDCGVWPNARKKLLRILFQNGSYSGAYFMIVRSSEKKYSLFFGS
jgi:hypothetical protein